MTAYTVELWYDDQWNDVTADTRQRAADSGGGWTATRGGSSRLTVAEPDPAELTLVFNNGPSLVEPGITGRYSLRNALSDLYGKLRRGTPIRATVPGLTAAVRFHGRVAKWPTRFSSSRTDRWTPVTAYGPLWWLQQGSRTVRSPLYRWYTRVDEVSGYWPLEDQANAVEAHTPTPGAQPARPTGISRFTGPDGEPIPAASLPVWGSGAPIPGSLPTIDLAQGGGLGAPVPGGTGTDGWQVEWSMVAPRDQADSRTPIWWETSDQFDDHPSDDPMRYEANVTGSGLTVFYGRNFTSFGSGFSGFDIADGQPHHYRVRADQVGGNIRVRVYIDDELTATLGSFADSFAGDVGQVRSWLVNPGDQPAGDALMPTIGHIAVANGDFPASSGWQAMQAWSGESAGGRFVAVGGEDGITVATSGNPNDTEDMGPQPAGDALVVLTDCVRTDAGMLVERRGGYALDMLQRFDLYNVDPLTIPFALLAPPLEPVDDLREVRNRVDAVRFGGGEYVAELTEGPLSVADDPDGIGPVPTQLDINPDTLTALERAAWWELAAGTVDAPRFAALTVNLDSPDVADLVDDITQLDIGSVIEVTGLDAAGLPPDPIRLLILGYTESCDYAEPWRIIFAVTPADVWSVGVLASTTRAATAGRVTTADFLAGVDTSMTHERADGNPALWTVDSADFPVDLLVSGVRLTATACTGSGDPQTFTITQAPVNGVAKLIPAGTPVQVAEPWRLAR